MDDENRAHIVAIPKWFQILRFVQIGLAAVALGLAAYRQL